MFISWKEKAQTFEMQLNHLQCRYTKLIDEHNTLLRKLTRRMPDEFVVLVLYKDGDAEIVEANQYSTSWHGCEFRIDDLVILRTYREILSIYCGPKNEMIERMNKFNER